MNRLTAEEIDKLLGMLTLYNEKRPSSLILTCDSFRMNRMKWEQNIQFIKNFIKLNVKNHAVRSIFIANYPTDSRLVIAVTSKAYKGISDADIRKLLEREPR